MYFTTWLEHGLISVKHVFVLVFIHYLYGTMASIFQFRLFLTLWCVLNNFKDCTGVLDLQQFLTLDKKVMTHKERLKLRNKSSKMFQFGFDNYMKYAYPKDELDPIHCVGRGHDHEDP